EDGNHSLARLIASGPNAHQSWVDFVEFLLASTLLRGNGLAEIQSDDRGAVTGLLPIPWEYCSVQLLASGRLVYDVTDMTFISGGAGRTRRLLQDQVLHIRDRSDDGVLGKSRLARAAAVVSTGLSMQAFAGSIYTNGLNPSGAITMPHKLTNEQ